ncbi:MAG: M3 family oligoendopeptidase, partial [Marivirga sp.]|nr:M3 family oligoendopeptidase [Marivirga sp.]
MADILLEIPKRPVRKFLAEDFKVTSWDDLKPHFDSLVERKFSSVDDLKKWFHDRSELESVIAEDLAWRYIQMTCYTENEEFRKNYQFFIENIQPQMAQVSDTLNKKAADSLFLEQLAKLQGYDIMIRSLKKEIEIFREENVPLYTEINTESQKYAQLNGAMTVEVDGKELTLQQAAVFLMSTDRSKREEVYHKITERRL